MATIKTTYLGELRTQAIHLASGSKLITDAPVDNHGRGENFSPTDLVAAALGSCMLTIMGIAATNHGFSIDGTQLSITKIMKAEPRRIGEVVIDFDFPDVHYTDSQKKIIEFSAHNCPVGKSLNTEVIQTIHFNYK